MLAPGFLVTATRRPGRRWIGSRALPFTIISVLFTGMIACSGPYLKNRWQDSKDVFTATIESESYGGALRLGPLKGGLNYKGPTGGSLGLRGGRIGDHESADFTAFFFGADYFSDAPIRFDDWKPESAPEPADNDDDDRSALAGADSTGSKKSQRGRASEATAPNIEVADPSEPVLRLRDKLFRALSPFGTEKPAHKSQSLLKDKDTDWAPPYYFTQAELQLGLYVGVRLGWNAGETFDWLVGWFGFDPLNDDAPYGAGIEEQLQEYPFWNTLSEEEKDAIRDRLREGGGTEGLLFGP
ncbi:MAG: hypothetical protein RIF32_12655 [Leptospirales bacterium]|jgi:hypothetical protein